MAELKWTEPPHAEPVSLAHALLPCPICAGDHRADLKPAMDRIELPEGWRIDGDFIVHTIGTRVHVHNGELCIEFDDERSCASLELAVVHAAVKLAEVTEIIEHERTRLMAERFAGRA